VAADSLEGLCPRCLLAAATQDPHRQDVNLSPAAGQCFGPYRIVRLLGEGGMGTVYLARQEEPVPREVALKVIGAGILHPKAVERFLDERQILGTLDHPNIARLLDGGVGPDGVPYMAMEYVPGVPIDAYCSREHLPLRRRLELFRAVCDAVHCAHQNLVVHRDIKPANILVTAEGVPKLVDFGIAKVMNASPNLTGTLLRPMTPDYASPEQLRGGSLTTATDIYSLGVVLYELLTGARPYRLDSRDLDEIVRTVAEQAPPRPSASSDPAVPDISEELDAIVLQAMRKEPQERYASAAELADDVTRYLDGAPVLARRGTFGYAARKLLTRYKRHAAAIGTGLALLAAGVVATGWQTHVADRERAKAQRRFDDLRGLAKSVIFELHDGIARLPGSTEVRKTLVTRALAYLNSLAADSGDDPALLTELAAPYRRVGDVQGRSNHPNLGDPEGALASYRKGLNAAQEALKREPHRDAAIREAGWLHLMVGEIYLSKRDAEHARDFMQEGLKLLRTRADAPGALAEKRTDLAAALLDMSLALKLTGDPKAREYLREATDVYERIVAAGPNAPNVRYNAAVAHRYLAASSDRAAAITHLQRALELDRMCVKADPSDAGARLSVAVDLAELARGEYDAGNFQEALALDEQSLAIREELAAADPADVLAQNRLGYIQAALARDLLASGDHRRAVSHARRSVAIYSGVVKAHPTAVEARSWLVSAYRLLGESERRLANDQEACTAFRHGVESFESLGRSDTANTWAAKQRDLILPELARCASR
jgi:non-specific serine/threonine protein kinase/serine/threonine-protein kinase